MRSNSGGTLEMFLYVPMEKRVPADHPLRGIRAFADEGLEGLSGQSSKLHPHDGRPLVPPEHLLKASLLQAFFTVRSERQLM